MLLEQFQTLLNVLRRWIQTFNRKTNSSPITKSITNRSIAQEKTRTNLVFLQSAIIDPYPAAAIPTGWLF